VIFNGLKHQIPNHKFQTRLPRHCLGLFNKHFNPILTDLSTKNVNGMAGRQITMTKIQNLFG